VNITRITVRIIVVFLSLLLTACTVGPDYVRPTLVEPLPTAYKELEGWKVAQPQDGTIAKRWWEQYDDPILNPLMAQVALSNLTIAIAEAQFRQARAAVQGARAGYFPSLTAGAMATRSSRSGSLGTGNSGSAISSNFQLPFDVSWELDLWGRIRREVEAAQAGAEASAADLAAVTLSAQAELASDYFQLRIQDEQKRLLDDTIALYRKALELTVNRYEAGLVAKTDVLQAEAQLKSTEAQSMDLGVVRSQLEHAIALLIGKAPASFSLPSSVVVNSIPPIPSGVPSELLERRPDIASAERRMATANAQIGIATAAYYPAIRLSAATGLESATLASLFTWPSRFWAVGSAASATLFDGGARNSQSAQANAAYDATVAAYRETVLTAFQEVEDNLSALRILQDEIEVHKQAVEAAQQVVTITTNQYQAGSVAYLTVVVAQATALANERTALSLSGRRFTASVLLVKALGGGWTTDTPGVLSGRSMPAAGQFHQHGQQRTRN
jgi:NodT family efflux transporter outer membrane factor (OMF) lipoprotein